MNNTTVELVAKALVSLGDELNKYLNTPDDLDKEIFEILAKAISASQKDNPWFTDGSINHCLSGWVTTLQKTRVSQWVRKYDDLPNKHLAAPKVVAIIMAGNIPMVGFHDLLCCLVAGHNALVKLSSDDRHLIPAMMHILTILEPKISNKVNFTESIISNFDAVIATGSDNTSRYFEFYFSKYPHLIRKNRNSLAVLTGDESFKELDDLCDDIFVYFGMGCRSVTKLLIPKDYDFNSLVTLFTARTEASIHSKYRNNYDYRKSIYIINRTPFIDHNNLLLVENRSIASPISVLYYQYYDDLYDVKDTINNNIDRLQCVVSDNVIAGIEIPFGKAQQPDLWDYSDRKDTLRFMLDLKQDERVRGATGI